MNKIYLLTLLSVILGMGLASALDDMGTFQQNKDIRITQTCQNSTYINISSINYPNSSALVSNIVMTPSGSGQYYYDINHVKLIQLGRYDVKGISDGCQGTFASFFTITPSGLIGTLGLFIIIYLVSYGIGFGGFFGRNVWVSLLGGMAMIALGLYTINNGIDVYRTFMTNVIAWTTLGLGALFSLTSGVEIIQETYN